jgi:hypothetical protein
MLPKYVVLVAACLEILVGAALLITPDAVSQLLFGGPADGISMPWARFAGVGLFGLGVSCARSASAAPRSEGAFGILISTSSWQHCSRGWASPRRFTESCSGPAPSRMPSLPWLYCGLDSPPPPEPDRKGVLIVYALGLGGST